MPCMPSAQPCSAAMGRMATERQMRSMLQTRRARAVGMTVLRKRSGGGGVVETERAEDDA